MTRTDPYAILKFISNESEYHRARLKPKGTPIAGYT